MNEGWIIRAQSSFYQALVGDEIWTCRIRGRLKQSQSKEGHSAKSGRTNQASRLRGDLVVIGDRVRIEATEPLHGVICEVHPREKRLSRSHPVHNGGSYEDVLIANLDQVVVVISASLPKPNPRLVDRFLAIAEWNQIGAAVVVNKIDDANEAELAEAHELKKIYEAIGVPTFLISALKQKGLDDFRKQLSGKVNVFAGPSGVGKSSLLRTLDPNLQLATGAISDAVAKGKHTTRVAEIFPVGGTLLTTDTFVADTPGIRELALHSIDDDQIAGCFVEIAKAAEDCRFRDCSHRDEPGCKVREAVSKGSVSRRRYESYIALRYKLDD